MDVSHVLDEALRHLGLQALDEILVGDDGQLEGVLLKVLDLK